MNLIYCHKFGDLFQFVHIFLCFRIRIDNIGHCLGTHNIVLFQRSYHILLVLFILLNHVDYTIQQYL